MSVSATSDTSPSEITVSPEEFRDRRRYRAITRTATYLSQDASVGGVRGRWLFIHLTYAQVGGWGPLQISECLKRVRQWCERRRFPCRVVWRFEFGERYGRPHYHLLLWIPSRFRIDCFDRKGWWPHGMTKTEVVRRDPVAYIAKYEAKRGARCAEGWDVKGARTYGALGLGHSGRIYLRWCLLPGWLRDLTSPDNLPARVGLGYWRVGGRLYRSPWRFMGLEGGLVRLRYLGTEDPPTSPGAPLWAHVGGEWVLSDAFGPIQSRRPLQAR